MSSSTGPPLSSAQPSQPNPQQSQQAPPIVSPSPAELALLDASCRILTVSASLQRATTFIKHVQALAKPSLSDTLTAADETQLSTTDLSPPSTAAASLLTPSLVKIPWTISNRYYTADVHFAAHTIHGLSPHVVRNVPAVVFVWGKGEAYKHHIQRLKDDLEGYDPDVMLAVRYKRISGDSQNDEQDDEHTFEDNSDIDAFLAEHGFEYVDASKESNRRAVKGLSPNDLNEEEEEDEDDIPRLPRVLDALGTIMWPSMRSTTQPGRTSVALDSIASLSQNAASGGNPKSRINDAHLDWARLSQDPIMAALDEITSEARRPILNPESRSSTDNSLWLSPSTTGSASSGFDRTSSAPSWKSSTELRTNKLGVRLDTGGLTFGEGDDPWRFAAADTGKAVVMSPVDTLDVEAGFPTTAARGDIFPAPPQPKHDAIATQGAELGFDDDFTVFVSAPAVEYDNQESHDDDSDDEYRDRMGGLVPPHPGEIYRSLGSVSDFGDSDRGRGDEDLSERIDNPGKSDLSKTVDVASSENTAALQAPKVAEQVSKGALPQQQQDDADKLEDDSDLDAYMPSQTEIQEVAARLFGGGAGPKVDSDKDEDYDMAPFDLPAVVGALQQMKAEIAGMTDEDERRRAAARVALGLVYGLEAER